MSDNKYVTMKNSWKYNYISKTKLSLERVTAYLSAGRSDECFRDVARLLWLSEIATHLSSQVISEEGLDVCNAEVHSQIAPAH